MKIGWSKFALGRNDASTPTQFCGTPEELLDLVHLYWGNRTPGTGRADLEQVVIVPISNQRDIARFASRWIRIADASNITATVVRRQPHEDPYLQIVGDGPCLPTKRAAVVLYSADTLLQDGGERSGDFDWEVVAILAGPWEVEPMQPLTMARNFGRKPGGTFAPYTAEQFSEAVYFWSQFIQRR